MPGVSRCPGGCRPRRRRCWCAATTGRSRSSGAGPAVGRSSVQSRRASPRPTPIRSRCSTSSRRCRPARTGLVAGGWFGYLGYRLGGRLEDLARGRRRRPACPTRRSPSTTTCCAATRSGAGGSRRVERSSARSRCASASCCCAAARRSSRGGARRRSPPIPGARTRRRPATRARWPRPASASMPATCCRRTWPRACARACTVTRSTSSRPRGRAWRGSLGLPGRSVGGARQPFARAVRRAPRPRRAQRPDQGHPPRLRGSLACDDRARVTRHIGEGPGREHDDRRPRPQRSRTGVRAWVGYRRCPCCKSAGMSGCGTSCRR